MIRETMIMSDFTSSSSACDVMLIRGMMTFRKQGFALHNVLLVIVAMMPMVGKTKISVLHRVQQKGISDSQHGNQSSMICVDLLSQRSIWHESGTWDSEQEVNRNPHRLWPSGGLPPHLRYSPIQFHTQVSWCWHELVFCEWKVYGRQSHIPDPVSSWFTVHP